MDTPLTSLGIFYAGIVVLFALAAFLAPIIRGWVERRRFYRATLETSEPASYRAAGGELMARYGKRERPLVYGPGAIRPGTARARIWLYHSR